MGMSCEVNVVLKLESYQGFPQELEVGGTYGGRKNGYRIYAVDIPIPLLDHRSNVHGLVRITQLVWEGDTTRLVFEVVKVYEEPTPYEC